MTLAKSFYLSGLSFSHSSRDLAQTVNHVAYLAERQNYP